MRNFAKITLSTIVFFSCHAGPKMQLIEHNKTDCNIEIVLAVHKNVVSVDDAKIVKFLEACNENCKDNVEFSEFSNEVLFELLSQRTLDIIRLMEINKQNIQMDYIYYNIANPLKDEDIDSIITKVKEVNCSLDLKNQLIVSLVQAASK